MLLGFTRQFAGGFGPGFAVMAIAAAIVVGVLHGLGTLRVEWRMSWRTGPRHADAGQAPLRRVSTLNGAWPRSPWQSSQFGGLGTGPG